MYHVKVVVRLSSSACQFLFPETSLEAGAVELTLKRFLQLVKRQFKHCPGLVFFRQEYGMSDIRGTVGGGPICNDRFVHQTGWCKVRVARSI